MLYSIKGKITEVLKKMVIVATDDFEFEVYVSKPDEFLVNEYIYLYLYHVIKEDDEYLVGFRTLDEKKAFRLLLAVQGIGPKSALAILQNASYDNLLLAISNNDLDYLKSIPGVGERAAYQIMIDLKEYIARINKDDKELYKEVKEALKSFKFKVSEIDKVLPKIYIPNATKDALLKEALRRLGNNG